MAEVNWMEVSVPNQWKGQQEGFDFLPLDSGMLPYPWINNAKMTGGFAGSGFIWEDMQYMWPCLVFAVLWVGVRALSKAVLFPSFARSVGLKRQSEVDKFSYNMWLLMFYTTSSLFGWFYALPGEKYFAFPVDANSGAAMFNYHPAPISDKIHWYYMYMLGFYMAELYAIFVEKKRSDFLEYVMHHLVTIGLISVSYVAHEHRIGALIIVMHDIPDVFLCAAKMFFYVKWENTSTAVFAMFVASFMYLRLYCLPMASYVTFYLAPQFHPATGAFWFLGYLLGVLQGLHIFWFAMIVKLIIRLITKGNQGDPRSDSDDDAAATSKSSGKKKGKGN